MKKIMFILVTILIIFLAFNVFPIFSKGNNEFNFKGNGIHNIEINTENSAIEIVETSNNDAKVKLEKNRNGRYRLEAEVRGDTLEIQVKRHWVKWLSFGPTPKLKVYLPEKTYGDVQVESKNGSISIEKLLAEDIKVETRNGKIAMKDIEASNIHSQTRNGKMIMEKLKGNLVAKSNNGDMEMKSLSFDYPLHLETDNGNIRIKGSTMPKNATFQLETDNGDIRVFGSKHFDSVIGNGKPLIKMVTDNGDITID